MSLPDATTPAGGDGAAQGEGAAQGDGAARGESASLTHPAQLPELRLVFLALCSGTMLAALDQTTVSVALPTIVGELGGLQYLPWVVTAFLLTSTVSTPLYGKISDLWGRKVVYQAAILIFLAGALLSAVAQDLLQLVVFRGIQGIGAGGLMAMAFVILADVVPPRERGRYVGVLTSVFAVASVTGPLIGGFLVDNASWRWVFAIHLPLGAAAMVVTQRRLHLPAVRARRQVDLRGAALMVSGVSCLLLALVWGGRVHPWGSTLILGLLAAGIALSAAFVAWQTRAADPLLPMRVFRSPVVSVASASLFVVGCAMFGGLVFLPLFLQVSTGASATESGLLMLPLMAGLMATAVASGRIITRTGRYKAFPVAGMGIAALGMLGLSTLEPDSARWVGSAHMAVLGGGIGMAMPTLMLAAQNACELRDLGVVSSAMTFFRSMGGAFGVAVFGAIFSARLAAEAPGRLAGVYAPTGELEALLTSPEQIRALPPAAQSGIIEAVGAAVQTVFLWAVPLLVAGFILSWFLKELPLRDSAALAPPASG